MVNVSGFVASIGRKVGVAAPTDAAAVAFAPPASLALNALAAAAFAASSPPPPARASFWRCRRALSFSFLCCRFAAAALSAGAASSSNASPSERLKPGVAN